MLFGCIGTMVVSVAGVFAKPLLRELHLKTKDLASSREEGIMRRGPRMQGHMAILWAKALSGSRARTSDEKTVIQ